MSGLRREFLRQTWWALRRKRARGQHWPAARHRLLVLPRLLAHAALLPRLLRSGDRRRRIAIALVEHMGDIVAAEPVARLARERFPDARIFWITRAPYAPIPAAYPEIDEVVTVGCLTEWMLLRRLRLFDAVWDLHINLRMCQHCRLPQVKPATVPDEHAYYSHGSLLDVACLSAGLPRLEDGPAIRPPRAAVETVDRLGLPQRYLVIHCESNDRERDWPAEKWRELAARILAADGRASVVEVGLRPLAVREGRAREVSLCGKLGLLETAEVIRRAALFIGIDSGPAHLANAVGTPGAVLLGRYRGFRCYVPYSGRYADGRMATIVRTDGPVAALAVQDVFAAVMARVAAFGAGSAAPAVSEAARADDGR